MSATVVRVATFLPECSGCMHRLLTPQGFCSAGVAHNNPAISAKCERFTDAHTREPVNEGRKDDSGKPRWDLLPVLALEDVARVLEFGARKYAPDNWRKVEGWRWRYTRAGLGHLFAFARGERLDSESGLPHLAHAVCCVLFMLELDR